MKIFRLIILPIFAILVITNSSNASDEADLQTENNSIQAESNPESDFEAFVEGDSKVLMHWDYLGCSRGRHDCRHEARHHGYHHSRIRHDHHCEEEDHHRPYGCYGKN